MGEKSDRVRLGETPAALVETTLELALKVGRRRQQSLKLSKISRRILPRQEWSWNASTKVVEQACSIVDQRGRITGRWRSLYSFQEQTQDENDIMLNGVGTLSSTLSVKEDPFVQNRAASVHHDQMAPEQQKSRYSSTSGRTTFQKWCRTHESVRKEQLICHFRCRLVRIFGRRVS